VITFAQSLISLFITAITFLSFPGTTEEEKTIVSHFTISSQLCFHSAILVKAENSSHWLQVVIITCFACGIHSAVFGDNFFIVVGLYFIYQSSFAIATFSTILLPLRKMYLSCFSQEFISC
jgi:hypothetical protein